MNNNSRLKSNEAILSSAEGYTAFSFRGYHIRFKAPYSLERYESVVNWDNGYLVVMAKYRHNPKAEEEYIADKADIIVNGYAFTREDDCIRVLNLNNPGKAVVFSIEGEVLETTMGDIELSIASRYLRQNKKFMED